jgi:hypothetical protein
MLKLPRTPWRVALLALSLSGLAPHPALAAPKPRPDAPPEVLRTATGTVEVGTLASTPYRIDIPTDWNQALIVYYHGYAERPYGYRVTGALNNQTQPLFDRGYAIIQSAYSDTGWALEQAYPETEQLRQYFVRKYGHPAQGKAAKNMRTFVVGASMGGALVAVTLELNPKPYLAGLDMCGAVGPTDIAFQRRFAHRAAFDFYFPGIMPPLVPSPPDFEETSALRLRAEAALKANPAAAAEMRSLTGLHTDTEVAHNMVYYTFVIADMQRRAGGNPFDNRNTLYTGTTPTSSVTDNALNDGVHRYAADPRARAYLLRHYTPNGHLNRPMLALHTTYDPLIPGNTLSIYAHDVALAGFEQNLVQQYIHRDGHCTFSADEVGRTFDELVRWTDTGQRPTPGALPPAPPRRSDTATNHQPPHHP